MCACFAEWRREITIAVVLHEVSRNDREPSDGQVYHRPGTTTPFAQGLASVKFEGRSGIANYLNKVHNGVQVHMFGVVRSDDQIYMEIDGKLRC